MGTAEEFVAAIHKSGIRLWVEDGRLHYRSAAGDLPSQYLSQIRERKAELIEFLGKTALVKKVTASPTPRLRAGRLPLSFAQERLWFLEQLGLVGAAYNVPAAFRLEGPLRVDALELAIAALMLRHESLRTRFDAFDGKPCQVIDPPRSFHLQVLDLSSLQHDAREERLESVLQQALTRPIDLQAGPLFDALLMRLGEQDHVLHMTTHHIVTDGWSAGVMMRDLSALYAAYVEGLPSPLPELPLQYADYAIWQREHLQGEVLNEQLQYWKQRLSDAPATLDLPTDRLRPAVASFKGGIVHFELNVTLSQKLRELAGSEGVTLFMLLLSAYQIVLSRWSGQDDVVVGSPIAGRTHTDLQNLIGFFVNTLVFRAQIGAGQSFREFLQDVKRTALDAYAHQELPFERLVAELHPQRDLSRNPICQVLFAMQNMPLSSPDMAGVKQRFLTATHVTSKWDLTLFVVEGDRFQCSLEFATDLFDVTTIERLASHLTTLLEGIVADPDCQIGDLSLLSAMEYEQLIVSWNETKTDHSRQHCMHELLAEQAARTPNAIALKHGSRHLTYGELDRRANQLAHFLRELGVGAEAVVGLCVERSFEMVVGLLGILKAGAAYMPLDPTYPQERLAYMLQDAKARALLTHSSLRDRLSAGAPAVVVLDTAWHAISAQRSTSPVSDVRSGNLAYVIYTSGSTGRPKGVMITHDAWVNYANWAVGFYEVNAGIGAPVNTSFGFDATITSLITPLLAGRTVTLLPEGQEELPSLGEALAAGRNYSLVKLTPAHLTALEKGFPKAARHDAARALVIGGEALKAHHIKFWRTQAPAMRLINEYGPTETVVGCSVFEVSVEQDRESIPIGKPIDNVQKYVLDARMRPAPLGVVGEL